MTVLVNGLPMVHIELKRRGVDLREAFNQSNRYQRDNVWAGSGLLEYVQLFVILSGTLTKYYSSTARNRRNDFLKELGLSPLPWPHIFRAARGNAEATRR